MTRYADAPQQVIAECAYLGIDQSLSNTGLCFETPTGTVLPCVLSPPAHVVGVPRLAWFRTQLATMIAAMPRLRMVAMEGYSFGSKFQRENLGELGGLVRLVLYDAKTPSVVAAPTAVKKFLLGKGGGKKANMIKEVFKVYGVDVDDDNEADAFVLCQIARGADTGRYADQTRKEVLDSLTIIQPKSPPVARGRLRSA